MARWHIRSLLLLTALLGLSGAVHGQEDAVLIDDTLPVEDPVEPRRVVGVSSRGELTVPPADSTPKAPNKTVRAALDSPTRMEFTEMPLSDAVAYLKDYHAIEIQVDAPALKVAGVGSDTPLTRNLNGLPLGAALRLLLEEHGLTYLVRDGVLMITTDAAAREYLELQVYDVSKLVGSKVKAEEVAVALASLNQPPFAAGGMGGGMGGTRSGRAVQLPPTQVRLVPFRNLLIVRASQHEHQEIAELLDELKKKLNADD